MLVFHIGLAKTGTTLLQYRVFPDTPGLTYVHRKRGRRANLLARGLRHYVQSGRHAAIEQRPRLEALIRNLAGSENPTMLVSDENVGVGPGLFWKGHTASPEKIARRLAALGGKLAPGFQPIRVLVGIRRQDQWLGSLYSDASLRFPTFGQEDFDRRVAAMIDAPEDDPALAWLDFRRVFTSLGAVFGDENVMLTPLERMVGDPRQTLEALSGFTGVDFLAQAAPEDTVKKPANPLSSGPNTWKLRRDGSPLRLDAGLAEALRARFAASNAALAATMPLGF